MVAKICKVKDNWKYRGKIQKKKLPKILLASGKMPIFHLFCNVLLNSKEPALGDIKIHTYFQNKENLCSELLINYKINKSRCV